jgi:hypothetical protein
MSPWSWTDPVTLAANRAGRLTAAQEAVLRPSRRTGELHVGGAVGLIGRHGDAVRAIVDGRHLGRHKGLPELPGAGWYQMYWLSDRASTRRGLTGWLLSVGAPPTTWPSVWTPGDADGARRRLGSALAFGAEDLAANHQGQLTDGQRRRLLRERRGHRVASGLVAAVAVFMAFLLLWILFGPQDGDSVAARLAGSLWPAIGLTASVTTVIAMKRERARATAGLRSATPVEHISGPVMALRHDDGDLIATTAATLPVSRAALEAFDGNRAYTVYYVAEPPIVLTAEPLTPAGTPGPALGPG